MMDIIRIMIVRIYILDLYKQKSQGKLHGKTKEQKYFTINGIFGKIVNIKNLYLINI